MNRRGRGMAFLSATTVAVLCCRVSFAAPAGRTVGVVDFFAPTPLAAIGIVPERFAADELSRLLRTQATDGRITLVPRPSMERGETSLHWQGADALRFERLRALAQAVGTDALIVGWIPLLVVNAGGGGGGAIPPTDGDVPTADTNLVLQVFDARQGRIVFEIRPRASVLLATTRDLLTEQVLREALARGVPSLLGALSAASP